MVTFTRRAQTYDPATGATTVTESTVTGQAIQVRGRPQRYVALGLRLDTMPTLLFTPTIYGLRAGTAEFVQPGDLVTWNGAAYTAKDVDPVAPDGKVIIARIVVAA